MTHEAYIPKHQIARAIIDASIPPHESLPDYLDTLGNGIRPFGGEPLQAHDIDAIGRTQLPWTIEASDSGSTEDLGTLVRNVAVTSGRLAIVGYEDPDVSDLSSVIDVEKLLVGTSDEMPFDPYVANREELLPDKRAFIQNKPIVLPEYSPDQSDLKLTDGQRYAINVVAMPLSVGVKRIGLSPETLREHLFKARKKNDVTYQELIAISYSEGLIDTEEDILPPNIDWDLVSAEDQEFIRSNLFDGSAITPRVCEIAKVLGLKSRDQLYIAALRDGRA